jgi:hypothetical protein
MCLRKPAFLNQEKIRDGFDQSQIAHKKIINLIIVPWWGTAFEILLFRFI